MTIGGAHVGASFLDPSAKVTVNTCFLVILSIYQVSCYNFVFAFVLTTQTIWDWGSVEIPGVVPITLSFMQPRN